MTLPNFISLLRLPLAYIFIISSSYTRVLILLLALLSDGLDGFIARKFNKISRFGTTLDPITDKLFVLSCLFILFQEGLIHPWQIAVLLARDISVLLFGCFLIISGRWTTYKFRAIWCGKVTTVLQFFVLNAIVLGYPIQDPFYILFLILGLGALVELYWQRKINPYPEHI